MALKAYCATDANWDAHELAKAIWTMVHEELRNKRHGRKEGRKEGKKEHESW